MAKVPCKNCPNRKIPKTCEGECQKWQEYQRLNKEEKVKILKEKRLKYDIENVTRRTGV